MRYWQWDHLDFSPHDNLIGQILISSPQCASNWVLVHNNRTMAATTSAPMPPPPPCQSRWRWMWIWIGNYHKLVESGCLVGGRVVENLEEVRKDLVIVGCKICSVQLYWKADLAEGQPVYTRKLFYLSGGSCRLMGPSALYLSLSAMQNPLTNVSEGGLVMGCVVVVVVVIVIDVDELELGRLVVGAIRNQVVGKKLVVTWLPPGLFVIGANDVLTMGRSVMKSYAAFEKLIGNLSWQMTWTFAQAISSCLYLFKCVN